jgi:hypothetical protein
MKAGGIIVAVGLGREELEALPLVRVATKPAEHIAAYFGPFAGGSALAGISPADVHNRDPRELPLISSGAQIAGDGILAWSADPEIVFCQAAPWQFDGTRSLNLKRTHRRLSFLLTRLLANAGAAGLTPLLERFHKPVESSVPEQRWLTGLYLDQPEEWDDPYRFFRW